MPDPQIQAGKTAYIRDKGGDSHGWGMWGQKTRQQKVQTANKVEGLRRQWRKDLGRSLG